MTRGAPLRQATRDTLIIALGVALGASLTLGLTAGVAAAYYLLTGR